MKSLIQTREKEYFSKDISLLRSFLNKKALNLSPDKKKNNAELSSISSMRENFPNKSQQTSLKVKELLEKTKNKLKLNKKTKENRFESKMKDFSKLESFIDTSHFIKNMNILNELKKAEENSSIPSGNLNMMSYFSNSLESLDEIDEEEPIFWVEGQPTTKFPRLKIKDEVVEKAKTMIRAQHRKGKLNNRYSFQFQDLYSKEEWNQPEVRTIGKDGLEPKNYNDFFHNRVRSSINIDNNSDNFNNNENPSIKQQHKKNIAVVIESRNSKEQTQQKLDKTIKKVGIPTQSLAEAQFSKRIKTVSEISDKKRANASLFQIKSKNASISTQISGYLLQEQKEFKEKFEEKFIEDLKSGKFLLRYEDEDKYFDEEKIAKELKKFSSFFQNNKKIVDKLKNDLKTGLYEEAFRNQAEKIGALLKRAARNIYNQKVEDINEITQRKNQRLKRKVIEISESLRKQAKNTFNDVSKSKYSHISSRYNNLSSLTGTNNSKLIEISNENSKESYEKSKDNHEKSKSISFPQIPSILQRNSASTQPKSILKTRIMSPIFLTDEKSLSLSKIEQNEQNSEVLSPGLKGHLRLLKRQKSSLYEAVNVDFDEKIERDQAKKLAMRSRNKKDNREMRQKLERLLHTLDESKLVEAEESHEIKRNLVKMDEKWEEIQQKTKGVDALRLLIKDYKDRDLSKLFGSGRLKKKAMKFI